MMLKLRYTDAEVKKLLSTAIILIDSREKVNDHIISYFEQQKIPYKVMKLDTGDYSIMLPQNTALGIQRDLYLPVAIERKNSIDELIGNFLKDKRTAFQNELIRSQEVGLCSNDRAEEWLRGYVGPQVSVYDEASVGDRHVKDIRESL